MSSIAIQPSTIDWKSKNLEYKAAIKINNSPDLYSYIPELTDPDIPLSKSFQPCDPQLTCYGKCGTVKFVEAHGMKFAVKRPIKIEPSSKFGVDLRSNTFYAELNTYVRNLAISELIGDHPNFMKVHAVVVKNRKKGKTPKEKPYMVLGSIEKLNKTDVSSEEKLAIAFQLKNAILHLHDRNIVPIDFGGVNCLVSEKKNLVFIDYDHWYTTEKGSDLCEKLYDAACRFVFAIFWIESNECRASPKTREELAQALDTMLEKASKCVCTL